MPPQKKYGLYPAIVVDDRDPDALFRIKVRRPDIGADQGSWAAACLSVAELATQAVALPPKQSRVWIMYAAGDPMRPVWIGCGFSALGRR